MAAVTAVASTAIPIADANKAAATTTLDYLAILTSATTGNKKSSIGDLVLLKIAANTRC